MATTATSQASQSDWLPRKAMRRSWKAAAPAEKRAAAQSRATPTTRPATSRVAIPARLVMVWTDMRTGAS